MFNYLSSNPLLDVFSRSGGGVWGADDELATPEMTSHLPLLIPVLLLSMTNTQLLTDVTVALSLATVKDDHKHRQTSARRSTCP